jgi:hypothetical protein
MAAYRAANSPPPVVSRSGPQAAILTPATPPDTRKPKITRITLRKHRLTVTVAGLPKGLRLRLVVQERTPSGRLVTLATLTSTRTTTTLRASRWDRITARFLEGSTLLPDVIVTRGKHRGGAR